MAPANAPVGSLSARPVATAYRKTCPMVARSRFAELPLSAQLDGTKNGKYVGRANLFYRPRPEDRICKAEQPFRLGKGVLRLAFSPLLFEQFGGDGFERVRGGVGLIDLCLFFDSDGSRPVAKSRFASWRAMRASFNPTAG